MKMFDDLGRIAINRKHMVDYSIIALICLVILAYVPKMATDFYHAFYPAGRAVLNFQNPYTAAPDYFNPPWLLILLAPLSAFPIQIAKWLWIFIGMGGYYIAFRRLGLDRFCIIAMFASPFVYYDLGIGNIEWLILLGATLPPAIGAWLVILKPQDSMILFLLWLKQRSWLVLLPVGVLAVLFALQIWRVPNPDMAWSTDIFPYGIPVGLFLSYVALKRNDKLIALAAAPFLSPYLAIQGWIFVLLPLTRNKKILVPVIAALWFFVFWFNKGT